MFLLLHLLWQPWAIHSEWRLPGSWGNGDGPAAQLQPISIAKKEANSKLGLTGTLLYPFPIEDWWVELKNMSLLENKMNKQS